MDVFKYETIGTTAVITIDNQKKINALTQEQYYYLGRLLQEIALLPEIISTVLIGKGKFFSAGADVSASSIKVPNLQNPTRAQLNAQYHTYLTSFIAHNVALARAFYTHPKILIFALNGPAIGLSAALAATADFVYVAPEAFLLTPFSSIGLVAEGVASRALVQKLGSAKANEALLMSKKISAREMKECGFANEIFEEKDDEKFRERVLEEVKEKFGDHLNAESVLQIKKLIKDDEIRELDRVNTVEAFGGIERFMSGIPQREFGKIARGEKKHKL